MGNTPSNTKSVSEEPEQGFSSTDSHTEDALIEKLENVVLKADENDTDNCGQKDSGSLDGSGLLPLQPYAGDCPHFIRTGSCNFGLDCRYNHPDKRTQTQAANDLDNDVIPEDSGPIECKYYQTGTADGCKYGKSCRHWHHGEESQNIVPELNFLGLPIRLGEKECPLYMRNATCRYGSRCAFNHPDPTPMTGMGSSNSSVDDKFGRQLSHPLEKHNGSPIHFLGASQPDQASEFLYTSSDNTTSYPNSRSSYVTPCTPPQQMQKQSEWNGYQASNSHQSANYSATPSADGSLRKSDITMSDEELLECPGHLKCDDFVKSGNRKFWSARRYHHPKDRKPKPEKGLPLSPMNFPFVLSEEDRLHSHISQHSQLKYIKLVLDKFDAGQKQDFRNSCFGYMMELAELQFSAQLMQQLMFRLVDSGKTNELWFNIKGHYTRFGLTEYALVTGLKCGGSIKSDEYEKTVQKKRLKERYFKDSELVTCRDLERVFLQSSTTKEDRFKLGLALIVEGVFIAPDKKVGIDLNTLGLVDNLKLFFEYPWGKLGYQRVINPSRCYWSKKLGNGNAKAKAKNEKEITYTIHGCPLAIQIWAYEAVPELGENFAKRLGFRTPRILSWTATKATKQQQQRPYEAFFENTPLQVYATLRPCTEEKNMEYITTLVSLKDNVVEELDDLALNMELPQCDEEEIGTETPKGSFEENEKQEMDTGSGSTKNEESSRGSSENVMHEGGKSSELDSENHVAGGHQTKMEFENVGTDAFESTPMYNKSLPETCLNEPSTSRRALSRDEGMEFLLILEKNLNEKMDKHNAIIMDRLEVFEKKVDEGFQQVNEFLNSKFERIDKHVYELGVDVRANVTTTECYSLLIKKDLQTFIVDQVNDLKERMKMQGSTCELAREGQATKELLRLFTPAPGLNRESTKEGPSSEYSEIPIDNVMQDIEQPVPQWTDMQE